MFMEASPDPGILGPQPKSIPRCWKPSSLSNQFTDGNRVNAPSSVTYRQLRRSCSQARMARDGITKHKAGRHQLAGFRRQLGHAWIYLGRSASGGGFSAALWLGFCREHVAQLREHEAEFGRRGAPSRQLDWAIGTTPSSSGKRPESRFRCLSMRNAKRIALPD